MAQRAKADCFPARGQYASGFSKRHKYCFYSHLSLFIISKTDYSDYLLMFELLLLLYGKAYLLVDFLLSESILKIFDENLNLEPQAKSDLEAPSIDHLYSAIYRSSARLSIENQNGFLELERLALLQGERPVIDRCIRQHCLLFVVVRAWTARNQHHPVSTRRRKPGCDQSFRCRRYRQ